jgi:ribosome-associated heat shock protein Hsp15
VIADGGPTLGGVHRPPAAPRPFVAIVAVVIAAVALLAGCSDSGDGGSASASSSAATAAGTGPFFGECGGVTTAEVSQIVGIAGLTNTTNNSSGCEWVTSADQLGPQFSFNWYRGSPIGRERATEQLSRESVSDLTINGAKGFIASDVGICEIGMEFGGDFFEWSVSYGLPAPGVAQRSTDQVCGAAKQLSTMSIERAK